VFWYVAFADTDADDIPADTTTVTVYDHNNSVFLNIGQHYDVSQGGVAMIFDQLNSSIYRSFTLNYFLINNTEPQGNPIVNIRSYQSADWGGIGHYYMGQGTYYNTATTDYEGDVLISLKNLDGIVDYNTVHVVDAGAEYTLSDDQFVFSGNSITINYEAVGLVEVGESKTYKVYFQYQDVQGNDFALFQGWFNIGFIEFNGHLLIFLASLFCGGYGVAELAASKKNDEEARGYGYMLLSVVLFMTYFITYVWHLQGVL
jgi:hypothetical protein